MAIGMNLLDFVQRSGAILYYVTSQLMEEKSKENLNESSIRI